MLVQEAFKQVKFEEVCKQLFITDKSFKEVQERFETYFLDIQTKELSLPPQTTKVQMDRTYFEHAYLISGESNLIKDLSTFHPCDVILASSLEKKDIDELQMELIVAGILCLLTFNGTCFSETERLVETERLKEALLAVNTDFELSL